MSEPGQQLCLWFLQRRADSSVRTERVLNKEKYYSVIPWGHVRFRRIDFRFGSETWNLQFRLSLSSKNALCSAPYTVWPFKIIKGEPSIPPGDLMSAEAPGPNGVPVHGP